MAPEGTGEAGRGQAQQGLWTLFLVDWKHLKGVAQESGVILFAVSVITLARLGY